MVARLPLEKLGRTADLLVPLSVRDLLGPPPLAPGEDPERYDRLFSQVAASLSPANLIDWLRCREVVNLTWKLQRLARIEGALLATHQREALLDTLSALRGPDKPVSPSLVERWARGEPQARREVAAMLAEYGADADAVMAQAVVRRLGLFEGLDQMATVARSQRDRLIADLKRGREWGRESALRHRVDDLDDIDVEAQR